MAILGVPVNPQQLGRQLRLARQHLGMTLDDVRSATGIPDAYLDAIERGRLEQLPSPEYARGYVRSYAATVRLDGDHKPRVLPR